MNDAAAVARAAARAARARPGRRPHGRAVAARLPEAAGRAAARRPQPGPQAAELTDDFSAFVESGLGEGGVMTRVICDITMSVNGYVAGPDRTLEQPLGRGGEQLHEWIVATKAFRETHGMDGGEDNADSRRLEEHVSSRRASGPRRAGAARRRRAAVRSARVRSAEVRAPERRRFPRRGAPQVPGREVRGGAGAAAALHVWPICRSICGYTIARRNGRIAAM